MATECVYCGKPFSEDRPATKEHIIPKNMLHKSTDYSLRMNLKMPSASRSEEFQKRDVCKMCNEGILSKLDAAAGSVFEQHFEKPILERSDVVVEVNCATLSRWLAKTAYNSARLSGQDAEAFSKLVPFILGYQSAPVGFSIYTNVVLPARVVKTDTRETVMVPATHLRCAQVVPNFGAKVAIKLISLHSFFFYLVLWPEEMRSQELALQNALTSAYRQMNVAAQRHTFVANGECVDQTLANTLARDVDKISRFVEVHLPPS